MLAGLELALDVEVEMPDVVAAERATVCEKTCDKDVSLNPPDGCLIVAPPEALYVCQSINSIACRVVYTLTFHQ